MARTGGKKQKRMINDAPKQKDLPKHVPAGRTGKLKNPRAKNARRLGGVGSL